MSFVVAPSSVSPGWGSNLPRLLGRRLSDGDSASCGSPSQNNANTVAGAGPDTVPAVQSNWERKPHVLGVSNEATGSFHSSPSPTTNDANTMSGTLRKRPPSSGGTPTEPSSCERPDCFCHLYESADDPQPRNSGSSMLSRCYWTLRRNRPMRFRPSSRVWEVSTR